MDNLEVIDIARGAQIISGTKSQAREILKLLVDDLPNKLAAMALEIENNNVTKLRDIVHHLRGGCAYCCVPRLQLALERFSFALSEDSQDCINDSYKIVRHEIDAVIIEYKKL